MKKNYRTVTESDLDVFFHLYGESSSFMTPELDGYYITQDGKYLAELSHGLGINNTIIYGLTVIDIVEKKKEHKLSHCFPSKSAALQYFDSLRKYID